jgi:hypothetical protein
MHAVTIVITLVILYFIYQFLFSSKSTEEGGDNIRRQGQRPPQNLTRGRHSVHPQMIDQGLGYSNH